MGMEIDKDGSGPEKEKENAEDKMQTDLLADASAEEAKSRSSSPVEDDWTLVKEDSGPKNGDEPVPKVLYADPKGTLYPKLPEQQDDQTAAKEATPSAKEVAPPVKEAPSAPTKEASPPKEAASAPPPHPDPKIQIALQAMAN